MRKIQFNLTAFVFLFHSSVCFCQLRNYSPIPQSPNAAALLRHGDIPIGHYTGSASVKVPIYTIKVKDFELPIFISYHGSGIKVADEAGPVGLGWAISLGGTISQIVNDRNDLPDNQFDDFGYIDNMIPAHGNVPDYSQYSCTADDIFSTFINVFHTVGGDGNVEARRFLYYNEAGVCDPSINPPHADPFDNDPTHLYDTEPDYFYYSFGNYSGKFFYDKKTQTYQPLDRSKIEIVYVASSPSQNSGWIITDEDGTVYNFFEAEKHEGYSSPISDLGDGGAPTASFSNYHLTSIELVNNQQIEFTYNPGTRICLLANFNETVDGYTANTMNGQIAGAMSYSKSLSQHSYLPTFLDNIIFPGGKMEFHWENRQDIMNDKRLVKIEVRNIYNKLIKTVDFDNDVYFQGIEGTRPNFSYANSTSFTCDCTDAGLTESDVQLKRLKLRSVTVSDQQNPYKFFYEETRKLPAKMSFGVDYWGYYNGNSNADTYLPDLDRLYIETPPSIPRTFDADVLIGKHLQDRRASEEHAKTWLLNKIVYPTGGSSEFEYELNTFNNFQFMGSINDNVIKSAYANVSYYGTPSSVSTSGSSSTPFTIEKRQTVSITINFELRLFDNSDPNLNYKAQIVNSNGEVVFEKSFRSWNDPIPGPEEPCSKPLIKTNIELSPGDYVAKIFSVGDIQTCVHMGLSSTSLVSLTVAYKDIPNENFESKGGGLRVKRIKDANENGIVKTKEMQYFGGQLMDFPNFYRTYKSYDWASHPSTPVFVTKTEYEKISLTGTSVAGIAQGPHGNFVGYDKVIESLVDSSYTNGYEVFHFWNASLLCNNQSLGPCGSNVANGLLSKKEILDTSGRRIKLDSMYYEFVDLIYAYGIIGERVSTGISSTSTNQGYTKIASYLLHTYPIYSSRSRLLGKISTTYSQDQKLTEQTDYAYNENHSLASETQNTSGAALQKTVYRYPSDLGDVEPFKTMVQKHQLNPLVSREEILVTDTINKKIISEKWGYELKNGFGILNLYENSLDGSASFTRVMNILSTDLNNNPTEVIGRTGIITAYIHDMSINEPIVVAKNARKDQIHYEGFNLNGLTNGKTGGCYDGLPLSISFVKPADGKIYLIDYWYKSDGAWHYVNDVYHDNYLISQGVVDEIRIYPKDCDITSFYYSPLVGISSIQDRNGKFTNYFYDELNRFSRVTDHNNNIIKTFEYHYKN